MSAFFRLGRRFHGLGLRLGAASVIAVCLHAVLLSALAMEAIAAGKEAR